MDHPVRGGINDHRPVVHDRVLVLTRAWHLTDQGIRDGVKLG